MKSSPRGLCIKGLFLCTILSVNAQSISLADLSTSYPSPELDRSSRFGSSIAIENDIAVVSAHRSNKHGAYVGQVFVYQKIGDEWLQIAELLATEFQNSSYFGTSVDIEDDVIVVSARGYQVNNVNEGVVFVYQRTGSDWNTMFPAAMLTNSEGQDNIYMGEEVKIEGDVIVASSTNFKPAEQGPRTGKLYVFEKSAANWSDMTETAQLTITNPGYNGEFGISLDIKAGMIAAGASYTEDPGGERGAVYIFNKSGTSWQTSTESAIVVGNPQEFYYRFGRDVSILKDYLFVATRNSRANYTGPPIVYVFKKDSTSSFEQIAALTITDDHLVTSAQDVSIHVETDKVFLATSSYELDGRNIGGVFVFFREAAEWESKTQDQVLTASDPISGSLGSSIAGNAVEILVGNMTNIQDGNSGTVHVFAQDFQSATPIQENQVFSSTYETSAFDRYGSEVAISGNYALVYSPGDDRVYQSAGAVYVLKLENDRWKTISKLNSPSGQRYANFGSAMDIYGTTIAIGDSNNDSYANDGGLVYIYSIENDTVINDAYQEVKPQVPSNYQGFGSKISLNEYGLAVGASTKSGSLKKGRILVFEKPDILTTDFQQQAVLKVRENTHYDTQIESLKFYDDLIVANCPSDERNYYLNKGELAVFKKPNSGWGDGNETEVLANPEIVPRRSYDQYFGNDLHVSDSLIITQDFTSYVEGGVRYLYGKLNSYQTSQMSGSSPVTIRANDYRSFGSSFAGSGHLGISSNTSIFDDDLADQVVLFELHADGWHDSLTTFVYPGSASESGYGTDVGIYGRNILVGAPLEANEKGYLAGAVYAYQTDEPYVERVYATESGLFGPFEQILLYVQFSEAISISGDPYLPLNLTNRIDGKAHYLSGSGTDLITFRYDVQPGDNSPVLDYRSNLVLKGGSIITVSEGRGVSRVLPPIATNNSISGSKVIVVQATPPVVAFTSDKEKYNARFKVTANFNKTVTGLQADDIQISNGFVVQVEGSGATYELTVQPSSEGPVSMSLKANAVLDQYGQPNEVSEVFTLMYDLTPPSVSFNVDEVYFTNDNLLQVQLTLSEISSLSEEDVYVDNLSIISFQPNGNQYDMLLLVLDDTCSFEIREGTFIDIAGNPNLASNQHEVYYDQTFPIPILDAAKHNYANGPISFSVSFGERVLDFTAQDLSIQGGSASLVSNGNRFLATVQPTSNEVRVSVPLGVCTDRAGNENKASSIYHWTVDKDAPSATYTMESYDANHIELIMNISEPVNDVKAEHFDKVNITSLEVENLVGDQYRLTIVPASQGGISFSAKPNSILDRAGNSLINSEFSSLITSVNSIDAQPVRLAWNQKNRKLSIELSEYLGRAHDHLAMVYDMEGSILHEEKLTQRVTHLQFVSNQSHFLIVVVKVGDQRYSFKVKNMEAGR